MSDWKKFGLVLIVVSLIGVCVTTTGCDDVDNNGSGGGGGNGTQNVQEFKMSPIGDWFDASIPAGASDKIDTFPVTQKVWDYVIWDSATSKLESIHLEIQDSGSVKFETKEGKGHLFASTKAGAPNNFYRVDWIVSEKGKKMRYCVSEAKAKADAMDETKTNPDPNNLDTGCYSKPWRKASRALTLSNIYRSTETGKQIELNSLKYGVDEVDSFDNDQQRFVVKNASNHYSRYSWFTTDKSVYNVYLCQYPKNVDKADSSHLYDAKYDKDIRRDDLAKGCNGGPWTVLHPYYPFNTSGWMNGSNSVTIGDEFYKGFKVFFDGKAIVKFLPKESAIVVKDGAGKYSFVRYTANSGGFSGDAWDSGLYCTVNTGKDTIEEAISAYDSTTVDETQADTGCNGGKWTKIDKTIPSLKDLGGLWSIGYDPTGTYWGQYKIADEFSVNKAPWVLYNTDDKGEKFGASTYYLTNSILYTCSLEKSDLNYADAMAGIESAKIDGKKLQKGCNGKAWTPLTPYPYLGVYNTNLTKGSEKLAGVDLSLSLTNNEYSLLLSLIIVNTSTNKMYFDNASRKDKEILVIIVDDKTSYIAIPSSAHKLAPYYLTKTDTGVFGCAGVVADSLKKLVEIDKKVDWRNPASTGCGTIPWVQLSPIPVAGKAWVDASTKEPTFSYSQFAGKTLLTFGTKIDSKDATTKVDYAIIPAKTSGKYSYVIFTEPSGTPESFLACDGKEEIDKTTGADKDPYEGVVNAAKTFAKNNVQPSDTKKGCDNAEFTKFTAK